MNIAKIEAQKEFSRRRKIATVIFFAAFLIVLIPAIIVKDFSSPNAWILWCALALFGVAVFVFLQLTRCPFCKKIIVSGAMVVTHCPHCRKQLVEKIPNRKSKMLQTDGKKGR